MPNEIRDVVIPGQILGTTRENKPGYGTFIEKGNILSERLGVLSKWNNYINIVPIKGRYSPIEGDLIIGVVEESSPSIWLVDIKGPYPAVLHVNEVPWDVEYGNTEKYLKTGDAIMAKILGVDESKKIQVTLKDRGLYKINGGLIINIEPSKVPRVIGKKGSMLSLLKKYIRCRIFVGKNGRIWIDGEDKEIQKVLQVIQIIENESITYGLTNRIEELLKKIN